MFHLLIFLSVEPTSGLLQQVGRQVSGNFVASFIFILLSDFIYPVICFTSLEKYLVILAGNW